MNDRCALLMALAGHNERMSLATPEAVPLYTEALWRALGALAAREGASCMKRGMEPEHAAGLLRTLLGYHNIGMPREYGVQWPDGDLYREALEEAIACLEASPAAQAAEQVEVRELTEK